MGGTYYDSLSIPIVISELRIRFELIEVGGVEPGTGTFQPVPTYATVFRYVQHDKELVNILVLFCSCL